MWYKDKRDDTHLNTVGAPAVAALAVEGISELNLPLAKHLNCATTRDVADIAAAPQYSDNVGYGFDFGTDYQSVKQTDGQKALKPFYFSFKVPDGNYLVTVKVGNKRSAGLTTVRAESRRLLALNCATRKGQFIEHTFTVNKRSPRITDDENVKLKEREKTYLNWDNRLTLEINGDAPAIESISIKPAPPETVQVFLCGNSTVVDQNSEPWASWGQMLPAFLDTAAAVVNLAESGESAASFMAAGRLKKALAMLHKGDFVIIEFGHNDEKNTRAGNGAYFSFMTNLKTMVDEVRAKDAIPVLVTPTARRRFENGRIFDTHGDYDDAVRFLAAKENVPLIDLTAMTTALYETLGEETSKRLLVHYPANTFPNQTTALADNTHFSVYGAYEVAKCVVKALSEAVPALASRLRPDAASPALTPFDAFHWNLSPTLDSKKPDGN
jgi:lysophospholipase L1-like esterase